MALLGVLQWRHFSSSEAGVEEALGPVQFPPSRCSQECQLLPTSAAFLTVTRTVRFLSQQWWQKLP